MKKINLNILLALLFVALAFSSCDDDYTTPFTGSYTIERAVVVVPVEINVIYNATGKEMTYILDDEDITSVIKSTLFGELPACSGDSIIELLDEGKLYIGCSEGVSIEAGTWTDDETKVSLDFKANVVPTIPDGFTMTLESPKINNGVFTSNASMVVPKATIAILVEESGLATLSDDNPDFFSFTFSFEMKSVN